ncbi:CWF19-like protein 2 isoform X1 [Scomber scombrus]|uniref:CWF19-like protein 2 isoform X1 n=1 Tax=Scomber scombrus TaxID=13677 RepID=A0AAV1PJH3_SCOSC
MEANGVSFESVSSIKDRKESKRNARQEAIEKAKQKYEKEERRKELKRQRGEDTWMLPEINQRLQEIEDEGSVKSKKKKEKKSKKKKEKKKKAKKDKKTKEEGDGSSESSEDSENEWVESRPQQQAPKAWQVSDESKPTESNSSPAQNAQRDEWMTFDFLTMRTTSTAEKRAEKERQKEEERAKAQAIEQAGLHKLELNPYWKDGGKGLPPEETAGTSAKKANTVVNDGGLSWLRKSFQRMKEQAERQQRSLNDVVAERYGSMEIFQQKLEEAEEAAYEKKRGGERERGSMMRGSWRKGEEEARERWRRKEVDETERDRWRGSERERDSSPTDRDRYSERGEDRERERERGGYRGRDRDRDRFREKESDRDRIRNQDREWERDGGRDRERDDERDRYRERDRERDRGRNRDADRPSDASSQGGNWSQRSLSLSSMKGRFLKPSGDDDSGAAPERPPPPVRPRAGFLKPSSDDEDSGPRNTGVPAWKKSINPARESDVLEKPQQEKEKDAVKTVPAAPESLHCDKAALTASRSESEEEEEEGEEEIPLLSDEEMNKLGAKLVKAEIMGNTALIEKLKSQLEAAHKAKESHSARMKLHEMDKLKQVLGQSSEDQEVLLFRTDQSGQAWPVKPSSGPQEPHGGRRKKKPIETHVDGERVRYFQDDDNVGLKEMVRREKMSSAQDQNALYSRMAAKVYLSLPAGVSMAEGHCLICPLQHHCSATGLDEDVWSEMQLFRRTLVRMFESQELDCVFMETHMNPRRRQHMVLECIPLPRELGDMAPIYFKKAIMECDEEWAMNKKVVDLSSKDIRQAVPRALPYFAVDFGLQGGFAHVIENEQKFPHYFGKEVVGGMMDLEPRRWRKPIRENFDDQRKKVLQFAQWWKPYDCTKTDG